MGQIYKWWNTFTNPEIFTNNRILAQRQGKYQMLEVTPMLLSEYVLAEKLHGGACFSKCKCVSSLVKVFRKT